ncbi:DUF2255 family protein [Nocardioides sp. AN3]
MSWGAEELNELTTSHSLFLTAGACTTESVELGMVVVDGELYVRSFRGPSSGWYRRAIELGIGQIACGMWTRSVTFSAPSSQTSGIEAEYRSKYGEAAGLIATPHAQAATVQIAPR